MEVFFLFQSEIKEVIMYIRIKFNSKKEERTCKITVHCRAPDCSGASVEYIEDSELENRLSELKNHYTGLGFKVNTSDYNPFTYTVYVINLSEDAANNTKMIRVNKDIVKEPKGFLYVGMTGLSIENRVYNHLNGIKSCSLVKKYFTSINLELCERDLSYPRAVDRESELTNELRNRGYWVYQN